jgi:hypothetical protein
MEGFFVLGFEEVLAGIPSSKAGWFDAHKLIPVARANHERIDTAIKRVSPAQPQSRSSAGSGVEPARCSRSVNFTDILSCPCLSASRSVHERLDSSTTLKTMPTSQKARSFWH